jgi:hypothetical protein
MFPRTVVRTRLLAAPAIALAFVLGMPALSSAAPLAGAKAEKKDKKDKKDGQAPAASVVTSLWRSQGDVSKLDLYWGLGSEAKSPKAPFKFVKEDVSGTNPKVRVVDANGETWNVKFAEEVHSEVACSRIAWACGFMVEESYFVPSGTIAGVSGLGRAKKYVGSDGSFHDAMFEKRPAEITRRGTFWSWDSNPFSGSRELSGLAILAVMLNDWDAKQDNNNVLAIPDSDGSSKDWYIVADWGGTLGKMGGVFSHSKWDLDAYRKQAFIEGVSGGQVKLKYSGKGGNILNSVPVEHARWFAGVVGQLTDEQLMQAFRAAGASQTEATGFAARIREKINELKSAVN